MCLVWLFDFSRKRITCMLLLCVCAGISVPCANDEFHLPFDLVNSSVKITKQRRQNPIRKKSGLICHLKQKPIHTNGKSWKMLKHEKDSEQWWAKWNEKFERRIAGKKLQWVKYLCKRTYCKDNSHAQSEKNEIEIKKKKIASFVSALVIATTTVCNRWKEKTKFYDLIM